MENMNPTFGNSSENNDSFEQSPVVQLESVILQLGQLEEEFDRTDVADKADYEKTKANLLARQKELETILKGQEVEVEA